VSASGEKGGAVADGRQQNIAGEHHADHLRIAAVNIGRTQTALGAFCRRLAARTGKAKAVTATARKLAASSSTMRCASAWTTLIPALPYYEQRYRQRVLDNLRRHGVALPYNYLSAREWRETFARVGLRVEAWEGDLKLHGYPAYLVFGRSLHFLARVAPRWSGITSCLRCNSSSPARSRAAAHGAGARGGGAVFRRHRGTAGVLLVRPLFAPLPGDALTGDRALN
jgi:hypothetical protein